MGEKPDKDGAAAPARIPHEEAALPGSLLSYFRRHPKGFWFIFWGEMAERCSYYGMRAILLLYMWKSSLAFKKDDANLINHGFIAACYLLPLLGGYLADNFLGKYWTLIIFCVPYIAGHFILGLGTAPALFVGLALLAMGTGATKPNIPTLMGMTYDQQRPGREKLRSDAFAMFYFAINIGAFLSAFFMPEIRNHWGYQVAFLFPAAFMVIALPIFAYGKPYYAVETVQRAKKTPEQRRQQWIVVGRLAGLFIVVAFFWGVYDQSSSTWIEFAEEHMDLNIFGWQVQADQFQWINPLLILILLPLITFLWKFLDARGWRLRPTDKMLVGFVLTTMTMGVIALAGYLVYLRPEEKLSPLWIVGAYIIVTAAEVCISVVGLELAFTAAPKALKSFVSALWLLTVAGGNLGDMVITRWYGNVLNAAQYFGMLTALLLAITVSFFFVAWQFNRAAARWQTEDPDAGFGDSLATNAVSNA
jgi:POT family proton-dependent oligopeptide transporter